ncbi:hypothetical protein Trydic_g13700 [Trypoxylus dichotomus]
MRSDRKADSAALKDKGGILSDRKMIIKRRKEYFQELLNTPSEVTIQQMHGPGDSQESAGGVFEEGKITEEHLEEVLKRLKNGKAPGDDKLTTQMFKNMGYHAMQLLLDIYNNVWEEGRILNDWDLSLIVPIYKKGFNKDSNNYRGIMLLNTVVMIYEQLLEKKLRQILEPTLLEV